MCLIDYLKPLAIEDWQSATKNTLTVPLVNGSLPIEKML